jgi:hypothetical protein
MLEVSRGPERAPLAKAPDALDTTVTCPGFVDRRVRVRAFTHSYVNSHAVRASACPGARGPRG